MYLCISLGHFYSFVHYWTNFIMHHLVSDHTFWFVHCVCKQVWKELVRLKIACSTCSTFGFKSAGFKTACSTRAWWIFPRLVDFASEDQVQNNKFHRWLVDFSTTCGFFNEKYKYDVDSKDLKEKENKRKRKRKRKRGKQLKERKTHLNKGKERGKKIRGGGSFTKSSSSSSLLFSYSISFSFFIIMQN